MDEMAMVGVVWAIIIFSFLIGAIFYVLCGISHSKALKALGYDKPWMAWIPFANFWALAEVALDGEENILFFDSLRVPAMLFKLWWLVAYAVALIPGVGGLLNLVLQIICLGACYTKMYARLDGKTEDETKGIGYVSGFLPIIAVFKFLMGHYA